MVSSKILERIAGVCLLIFGSVLYYLSTNLKVPESGGWMINIAVFPKWLGGIIVLLSIGMIIQSRWSPSRPIVLNPKLRSWVLVTSLVIYILLLPLLGYFAGSILWITVLGLISQERRISAIIATALIVTFLGYIIFWKILYVPLPVGRIEELLGLDELFYR